MIISLLVKNSSLKMGQDNNNIYRGFVNYSQITKDYNVEEIM